ncbi:MAG: hypothetical protein M1827_006668 [Pycnora praestabilis]|nr:MAG: hypothetical protein M1827_006668 [Pycnora praestabilis]
MISSTTSSTVPASTTSTSTSTTPTLTSTSILSTTSTTSTTPSPTPTTFMTSTSNPQTTSTWTPTPVVTILTLTGQIETILVTPTQPPAAPATTAIQNNEKSGIWSSTGKVAGVFTAVAIVALLLAGGVIYFFLRKRRNDKQKAAAQASMAGAPTPPVTRSRSVSESGLLGGGVNEKGLSRLNTGPFGSTTSPNTASPSDRRSSGHMVVDQRLEPAHFWSPHHHPNASAHSINTLRDDNDYTRRVLTVTNPDG